MEECSRACLDLLQAPQGPHGGSSINVLSPGVSISNLRDYQSTLVKKKSQTSCLESARSKHISHWYCIDGVTDTKEEESETDVDG